MMATPECPQCGTLREPGATVCASCLFEFAADDATVPAELAAPSPWRRLSRRQLALIVGIAVLSLGTAVLLLATLLGPGDGSPAAGEPSSSASASDRATPAESPATATPSPSASAASAAPSSAPDLGVLPLSSLATVMSDGLRIRVSPSLSGHVVSTLAAGEVVWVGPSLFYRAEADGIDWYFVAFRTGYRDWPVPPGEGAIPEDWDVGWVAAGAGDDRYLEPMPPRCSEVDPDLNALNRLTGWEHVACFGDRPITLTGTWGCQGCGGTAAGNYEPRWLAYPMQYPLLWVDWGDAGGIGPPLGLRLAPESGLTFPTELGPILRVTGHFDDAASATCVMSGQIPEIESVTARLYCREQFVVETFEIIGTDPEFSLDG